MSYGSCSPCGCAFEECECAEREAHKLLTLPPASEIIAELDIEPDPIFGNVPPHLRRHRIERFLEINK